MNKGGEGGGGREGGIERRLVGVFIADTVCLRHL